MKKCDYNQEIELKIRREKENIKINKQNQTKNIKLSIRLDACISCTMCEYNCKNEAIKVLDNEVIWDKDKCNGCMICAKKCPTQAIDVIYL